MERWTRTPEGTWNVLRTFEETHAISAMASSTTNRIRGRTLRDESLETNTARDLEQVVRMFVEMDVGPVSPSSTTWYEKKRSETNHWSKPTQASLKTMCVWVGKQNFTVWSFAFLLFRVRMPRMWGRKTEDKKELTVWALFAFLEFQTLHTAKSAQDLTTAF